MNSGSLRVTKHQIQIPKFSSFKPVIDNHGLAIPSPECPPLTGVMEQAATAGSLMMLPMGRQSGSQQGGVSPTRVQP